MSGLQIYQDQENQHVQTRNNAKRADVQQAQKRTALGQVTNQVRRQPSRAAKDKTSAFAVYEDSQAVSSHQPFVVSEDVCKPKSLKRERPPLGSLRHVERTEEFASPMAVDTSCMEVDDEASVRDLSLYCLTEYQTDMHDYLRQAEMKFRPKPNYMRKQTDISPQMRLILVDWLVEVGEEYKLHDETLHLAVGYIDRFLSQMSVLRNKLQLVGTACMYIASKYEEIYPPELGEFVYITDDTYTKKQLLRMEALVCKVLGFELATPTANVFADLYCQQIKASDQLANMTKYIMELTLMDCGGYLSYQPSLIASSALFLSVHVLGGHDMALIESVTRYSQSEVAECVQKMFSTLKESPSQAQQAVREKYKMDARRAVATLSVSDLC